MGTLQLGVQAVAPFESARTALQPEWTLRATDVGMDWAHRRQILAHRGAGFPGRATARRPLLRASAAPTQSSEVHPLAKAGTLIQVVGPGEEQQAEETEDAQENT